MPTCDVFGDFKMRTQMITRVSNMLTTRSDTFTVYALVQGWAGAGTLAPSLVVQRRAAFIADRSTLSAKLNNLNLINVQSN